MHSVSIKSEPVIDYAWRNHLGPITQKAQPDQKLIYIAVFLALATAKSSIVEYDAKLLDWTSDHSLQVSC